MDWDNARRLREPIAWILLIIATVGIALGLWTLAGLPGGPSIGDGALQTRALLAVNYFSDVYAAILPILAVILVTFTGGLTKRAGQLITAAAGVQALAVGLGVISLAIASQGGEQPAGPRAPAGTVSETLQISNWTYVSAGRAIALVAAGLILSLAILRSPAVRPVAGSLPPARRP
jgi:hypothetical protein